MNDSTGTYDLQYDRLHKLTSFNISGGSPIALFGYDGDGMRVIKTSAERTTVYHYNSGGRVISETESNGNRISDFVYANGKMVAKLSPTSLYFYHTDPAGTPMAMTENSDMAPPDSRSRKPSSWFLPNTSAKAVASTPGTGIWQASR